MASHDGIRREVLPVPDRKPVALTTYDAKSPDTGFPPITPLRPPARLPSGKHQIRVEFAYGGGGLGKGATLKLYVDGKTVGKGRIERTHAFLFSMDETLDIGRDEGEPVSSDYGPRDNAFSGKVEWVQIDIDAAAKDADHMIGAEERFHLAMARQ